MKIKGSNRLNSIFSLWFLVVAIAPVAVVAFIGQRVERQHVFSSVIHELGTVTRLKEAALSNRVENGLEMTDWSEINEILHEDINDTKYLTGERNSDYSIGVGRTADVMLFTESGEPLSESLMAPVSSVRESFSQELQQWFHGSKARPFMGETMISGRDVFISTRNFTIQNTGFVLIATIDRAEVLSRIRSGERNLILGYIASLVVALAILYMFVRSLGGLLVRPITGSINGLVQSSNKLNDSIATTESIVNAQEQVASNLSKSYRAQLKDVQAVHGEITDIVTSLGTVHKQISIAASNAATVDHEAEESKRQAGAAGESLSSVRHLSNTHEMLITGLTRYSAEVNEIAGDVHKLSQAITYLSLNAGIEAAKGEDSSKSIAALISEVGKLSRMSREASLRINTVVETMQKELHNNKEAAAHERRTAERGITVITSALQTLKTISQSAARIANSVRLINTQISIQYESAEGIVTHSQVLAEKAQATFRDANRIARLASEQKVSVASNISVVKKMFSSIEKLSRLIGSKNPR